MRARQTAKLPSPDDARRELARRELARRELLRFGQYVQPNFKIFAHQKLVAEALGRVAEYVETRGRAGNGRLMVLMPPQHGKSLLAAVLFSAWSLGRWPSWRIVMVSYNAKRAERNSKAVRDLVASAPYAAVFGALAGREDAVSLSSDSRGVSAWSLAQPHAGGMISAGVGGSITGYDARVIVIDDPFAGREDAESPNAREAVKDWYESQVYSRQQEGTAIILFHTRWHPDDLAGHLIREMASNPAADRWEIINLPALALADEEYPADETAQSALMEDGVYLPLADALGRAAGETLCREIVSQELMENIRANMNQYNFQSLYQQMPFLRTGGQFKRAWFVAETLPDVRFVKAVWYWDSASRANSGDYSVGVLMAREPKPGRVWVLRVERGQWSTLERRRTMRAAYEAAQIVFGNRLPVAQLWHPQDPGSAGLDSARDTNNALEGLPAHFETMSGDKETRADPWSSALEADNVRLLKGAWNQVFIDEHVAFPKGQHDDQVDAAALAYTKLINGEGDAGPLGIQPEQASKWVMENAPGVETDDEQGNQPGWARRF